MTTPLPDTTGSPVHDLSDPGTYWTTHNAAEVMPGVLTPLGASFWIAHSEVGLRAGFRDFGVLRDSEVTLHPEADRRLGGVFYGRYAINVGSLCRIAQRTPGSSGGSLERQFFGEARGFDHGSRGLIRYPVVAARMPVTAARARGEVRRVAAAMHTWWTVAAAAAESITGDRPGDLEAATELFREAGERMFPALRAHMVVTMLGQAVSDRLLDVAVAAGLPGHELQVTTGFGGLEETRLVVGLWEVGRGERSMDAFLGEFGFHGPAEGELSSRSWREDPSPLRTLAKKYAQLPDARHPLTVEGAQTTARREAETELLNAVGRLRRGPTRALLALGRAFIPDREIGKWAFLRGIDGARAAARAIGRSLAAQGVLAEPDDVMFLSVDELLGGLPAEPAGVVVTRREQHAEFARWSLPNTWAGMPVPTLLADRPSDLTAVTGYPASPGVVEGPARVVRDADGCEDLLEGEILVCPTTDPAWVSAFYIAAALVVDVGGPSSHAAIVARELGVPAVVGTEHGTASIRTGDVLRVNGATGAVEVLVRACATGHPISSRRTP